MKATGLALLISALFLASCEQYRPRFHFTPKENWMNDPNGMFYDPGTQLYHLYFQYNPEGNKWGHMSWGHAVSKNRLDW